MRFAEQKLLQRGKIQAKGFEVKYWESSLTISAKPVGVGAPSQPWILAVEQCSLLTRTVATVNALLCVRMKS